MCGQCSHYQIYLQLRNVNIIFIGGSKVSKLKRKSPDRRKGKDSFEYILILKQNKINKLKYQEIMDQSI